MRQAPRMVRRSMTACKEDITCPGLRENVFTLRRRMIDTGFRSSIVTEGVKCPDLHDRDESATRCGRCASER